MEGNMLKKLKSLHLQSEILLDMSLISSISGIRGTIGGKQGNGLTPDDIVRFTASYASWLIGKGKTKKVVIGRDGRISGEMVSGLVANTLLACGIDVVDIGMATTPTVEMAVPAEQAGGGIIITASHNPKNWNALKLLNAKGEFIEDEDGREIMRIAESSEYEYAAVEQLGHYSVNTAYLDFHIRKILDLPLVNIEAIKKADFTIVVDAVNSVGGFAVPELLRQLGVFHIIELNCEPNGKFVHNPEPLPEHLSMLSNEVKHRKAHLGIAIDPDVDRLSIVKSNGDFFGEEYTLVAVADYVLQHQKGNTVSNLSSSRALKDITLRHGCEYFASAVGEVNVVKKMKEVNAVIGGEGNGGVIYPELHFGRDALVGIALFLSHLASSGKSIDQLRAEYPNYYLTKNKIELSEGVDLTRILQKIKDHYKQYPVNDIDGIKIEIGDDWIHLRRSNTEPIIRIYAESKNLTTAENMVKKLISDIKDLL